MSTLSRGILLVMLACSGACQTPPAERTPGEGRLLHTVYFWMNDTAPADAAAQLRSFYRDEVPAVPGIVAVFAGRPRPSDRAVVDDSFDLGVSTLFADAASERGWQAHPVHTALKQRFEPWLDRVVVYDTRVD